MKRLLILSLLMIQGLWGAAAAGAQTHNKSRTLKEMALLQVMLPILTRLSDALAQDPNAAMNLQDANDLEAIMIMYDNDSEQMVKALYVAWLNADTTRPIIVRQTAVQACRQMGIDNVPAEWAQLIVDVSSHLRHGITSLHTRPGTIAHLMAQQNHPVANEGCLFLSEHNLTVCDVWNIRNPTEITDLRIRDNYITTISPYAFNTLTNLKYIEFENNKIKDIKDNAFAGLNALENLEISGNNIENLANNAFTGLNTLFNLNLSDNKITIIPENVFSELKALEELNLEGNKITIIPENLFAGLNNLKSISLSKNQITIIPENVFSELKALESLFLDRNQITIIPENLFAGLNNLGMISLRENPIEIIPKGLFAELNNLYFVSINNESYWHVNGGVDLLGNPIPADSEIRRKHPEWFALPAPDAAVVAVDDGGD